MKTSFIIALLLLLTSCASDGTCLKRETRLDRRPVRGQSTCVQWVETNGYRR